MQFFRTKVRILLCIFTTFLLVGGLYAQQDDLATWIAGLQSGNAEEIQKAKEKLISYAKEENEHLNQIHKQLDHKESNVRLHLSILLGELGTKESAMPLSERFSLEKDKQIRKQIALSILKIGTGIAPEKWATWKTEGDEQETLFYLQIFRLMSGDLNATTEIQQSFADSTWIAALDIDAFSKALLGHKKSFPSWSYKVKTDMVECLAVLLTKVKLSQAQAIHELCTEVAEHKGAFPEKTTSDTIEQLAKDWKTWCSNKLRLVRWQDAIEKLADANQEESTRIKDSLKKEQEIYHFLAKYLSHNNTRVRFHVVDIFSAFADNKDRLVLTLHNALPKEKEAIVIRQYLAVLAQLKDKRSAPLCLDLLENIDARVRMEAAWNLVLLEDEPSIEKLAGILKNEKSPEVRAAMLRALACSRYANRIEEALNDLPDDLNAEKAEVLHAAVDCAAVLGNKIGMDAMADIAKGAPDAKVRLYAAMRLMGFANEENANIVVPLLQDEDLGLRKLAFQKLMELTVQSLGYDAQSDEIDRAISTARWETWWQIRPFAADLSNNDEKKRLDAFEKMAEKGITAAYHFADVYDGLPADMKEKTLAFLGKWNTAESFEILAFAARQGSAKERELAFQGLCRLHKNASSLELEKEILSALAAASEEEKIDRALFLLSLYPFDNIVVPTLENPALEVLTKKLASPQDRPLVLARMIDRKASRLKIATEVAKYLDAGQGKIDATIAGFLLGFQQKEILGILLDRFAQLDDSQKILLIGKLSENKDIQGLEKLLAAFAAKDKREKDEVLVAFTKAFADNKVEKAIAPLYEMLDSKTGVELLWEVLKTLELFKAVDAQALAKLLKEDTRPASQMLYLKSLVKMGFKDLGAISTGILSNAQFSVALKVEAARILCENKDTAPKAAEFILKAVVEEKDANLRKGWLKSFDSMKEIDKGALAPLATLLEKTDDEETRMLALQVLTKVPYEAAQATWQSLLEKDNSSKVRDLAIKQMLANKKPELSSYFEKIAKESKDKELARTIRNILVMQDPKKAVPLLVSDLKAEALDAKAFADLALVDAEEALRMFPEVFAKAKEDKDKLEILRNCRWLLKEKDMPFLLKLLSGPEEKALGEEVARILARISGVETIYKPELSDEDKKKAFAIWEGWHKKRQDVDRLLPELLKAKPGEEQEKIMKELLGYEEIALNAMVAALKDSKVAEVREILVEALGRMKGDKSLEALNSLLADKNLNAAMRSRIYRLLVGMQDQNLVKNLPILYLVESEPLVSITLLDLQLEHKISIHAADWTRHLSSNDPKILAILDGMLVKYDLPGKKQNLLRVFPNIADDRQKKLAEVLQKDISSGDIESLVKIMGYNEEKFFALLLPCLQKVAEIPKEELENARKFMSYWEKNKESFAAKLAIQTDIDRFLGQDAELSQKIQAKLEKNKGKDREEVVLKLALKLEDPSVSAEGREKIVDLVGSYKDKACLAILEKQLTSEQPSLRKSAALWISKIGYSEVPEVTLKAYKHEDPTVRFFAVRSIGQSKDKKALPLLAKTLFDSDARVREESLFWAIRMDFDDKDALLRLVVDRSPSVRAMSIERLESLKEMRAVENLIASLGDPFPEVRKSAYQALTALSGQTLSYSPDASAADRKKDIEGWLSWWQERSKVEEAKALLLKLGEKDIALDEVRKRVLTKYEEASPSTREKIQEEALKALANPKGSVRLEVAKLLGEFKEPFGKFAVAEKGLVDPNLNVRNSSIEIVEKFAGEKLPFALDKEADKKWQAQVTGLSAWWTAKKREEAQSKELASKLQEVFQKLEEKKIDHATAVNTLAKLAMYDIPALEAFLKDAKKTTAMASASALCQLKSFGSVPKLMELLEDSEMQPIIRKSLESMIGKSLRLEPTEEAKHRVRMEKVTLWWQETAAGKDTQMDKIISDLLRDVALDPKKIDEIAKKLKELGPSAHAMMKEYLADTRTIVKDTLASVMVESGDKRLVSALLASLKDFSPDVRRQVLLYVKPDQAVPDKEEMWESTQQSLITWWQTREEAYKAELQKQWLGNKAKLTDPVDPQLKKDAIADLVTRSPQICEFALQALKEKDTDSQKDIAYKVAILEFLKARGDWMVVSQIIPMLTYADENVRKAALDAISTLSQQQPAANQSALPGEDDPKSLWKKQLEALAAWWAEEKANVSAQFDQKSLEDLLLALAAKKIEDKKAGELLASFGSTVVAHVLADLQSVDDRLRLGSAIACGMLPSIEVEKAVLASLADPNVEVRQALLASLQTLVNEKLPVVFDPADEKSWQKKVSDWYPTWKENQVKKAASQDLENLKKHVEKVEKLTRIWSSEQLSSVEKIVGYLKSPHKEAQEKALEVLRKVSNNEIRYSLKATPAEQEQDDKDLRKWLDRTKKDLADEEEKSRKKIEEIEKNWPSQEKVAAILTSTQCDLARDIVYEMTDLQNGHPSIQKKLIETLEKHGYKAADYDVYESQEAREKKLTAIDRDLYKLKNRLSEAAKDAERAERKFEKALQLKKVDSEESLQLAGELVKLLPHLHYPLRQKVSSVLVRLAGGKDMGYVAEKTADENAKAIEDWNAWLNEERTRIQKEKGAWLEKVEKVAAQLADAKAPKSIEDAQTYEQVTFLVAALQTAPAELAKKVVAALTPFSKEVPQSWEVWLAGHKKSLDERMRVAEIAALVKNAPKATTRKEAEDIGFLVNNLGSSMESIRRIAFEALSSYASRNVSNEVREDFGYAPNAPEDVRKECLKHWLKWYLGKVQPIIDTEFQREEDAKRMGRELANNGIRFQSDIDKIVVLVKSLEDPSVSVRQKALESLVALNKGENYGFELAQKLEWQKFSLICWKLWLKRQKRSVKAPETPKVEAPKAPETPKVEAPKAPEMTPEERLAEAKKLLAEGQQLLKADKFGAAVDKWNAAIEICPTFAPPYLELGDANRVRGYFPKALEEYQRLHKYVPENAEVYYKKGLCYSELKKWKESIVEFTMALKYKPDWAEVYRKRAMAYQNTDEIEKAFADLEKAAKYENK